MASRALSDLHPTVSSMAQLALNECRRKGLEVLVTCTYRSNLEQDELYAQGRTKPGPIVTNARGGQSAHNFTMGGRPAALGLDIVPLRLGKPVWGLKGNGMDDNPADDSTDDLEYWQRVRACFEAAGLKSGSRWTIRDWPHMEHPDTKEMMK